LSRVLIVSAEYGPPWAEGEKNIARALVRSLTEHGWRASVCSNPQIDTEASSRHHLSLRGVGSALRFWVHTARAARERGASVIHLLSSVSSLLGAKCAVIKGLSGASLLLHVTGLASPLRGYRLGLRADRIAVGGSYLRPYFPDAVDLPPMSPHMNVDREREARREPFDDTPRRILYLGAMEPERGVQTLIDALALLRTELGWPDFTLTLAWNGYGSKGYARRMSQRVHAHGLDGQVHWQGVAPDLDTLYRAHDCVVIPRLARERMGFPLRLIEALSYGKPVVVSDVGEMPIVTGGCGLVFPRGDTKELAYALRRLLSDRHLYRRCIGAAYEAARRYESSRTVGRYLELYRQLTQAR